MSTVAAILKHKGYQVSTVDPTTPISEIAQLLSEHRIGAVLVIDNTEQMLGIVSERDIVRSLAANGGRTLEMTAGQLMTRAVHVAHPDTTVEQAMQMMTAGRFRHLPVHRPRHTDRVDQHRGRGEGAHHASGQCGGEPDRLCGRVCLRLHWWSKLAAGPMAE